eukprot:4413493-Pyramimonas_sp.AAC.1
MAVSGPNQVGQKQTRVRPVAIGGTYELPPPAGGVEPSLEEELAQGQRQLLRAPAIKGTAATEGSYV